MNLQNYYIYDYMHFYECFNKVFKDRKWLGYVSYRTGQMSYKDPPCPSKGPLPSGQQVLTFNEHLV